MLTEPLAQCDAAGPPRLQPRDCEGPGWRLDASVRTEAFRMQRNKKIKMKMLPMRLVGLSRTTAKHVYEEAE